MHGLVQDVRYALRQFIHRPGFALTAVISLALGIGATTAVFSVLYGALMDPFPYRAADRIVRLTFRNQNGSVGEVGYNSAEIRELRNVDGISSLLVMDGYPMVLTGHDLPMNVRAMGLVPTGFADLGVPPVLGRGIAPADAPEGQEPQPVIVLSYEFWRKQFLSDPDVVGKTLQLDHRNYTVIGVAAPRFTWYRGDVYLPLKLRPDAGYLYYVNARLKPGVTFAAVNSALDPLLQQFAKAAAKRYPEHFRAHVEGLNEWVVRGMSGTLYLLFGAVGLLLAIGCSNVSILLLARGAAREHELAVRAAVGARRRHLVRQLLSESMLLSAPGVLLGVWLSYAMLAIIRVLLPKYAFAPEVVIRMSLPVLLFSAGVALATGVMSGLWPSLRLSQGDLAAVVQPGTRRVVGSVRGRRSHNALVAAQIALTLLLLVGAGAAMEGFLHLLNAPLGYDPHHVLSLQIPLRENSYNTWESRGAYFEQLRAKVAETPGVIMTAISFNATPPRNGWDRPVEILGQPASREQKASFNLVGPTYFPLLRIPLLRGRVWTEAENARGAHLAVVNRALVKRYFGSEAIGHSIKLPGLDQGLEGWTIAPGGADSWLEIIGVVEDAKNNGLDKPVDPAVFLPYTLMMWRGNQILLRTTAPPLTLLRSMKAKLAAVNPDQQINDYAEDLETWIADEPAWQQAHLTTWVFGIFAGLALVLAGVGMFSVVAYTMAQRANEFGIRMALGATPADVLRIAFASTTMSVGAGVGAGLILAIGLSKVVGQWVKGGSRDPWILLSGVAVLGVVSAIASAVPAWRASRADPMAALRCP